MHKKPKPLAPPEGSKASVYAAEHTPPLAGANIPDPTNLVANRVPISTASTAQHVLQTPKKPNSKKIIIWVGSGVGIALVGWISITQFAQKRDRDALNEMLKYVSQTDAAELPVNAKKVDQLLDAATQMSVQDARQTVLKALLIAKATDAVNVDKRIAEFTTSGHFAPDMRDAVIREVLQKRKNNVVVPYLLDYAIINRDDTHAAVVALQAIRFMADLDHLKSLLDLLVATDKDEIRRAIEVILIELINKAPDRNNLANQLAAVYPESTSDLSRFMLLNLMARCGGATAATFMKTFLDDREIKNQIAAISALGSWADDSGFESLTTFISSTNDLDLRNRAFDSALRFLSTPAAKGTPSSFPNHWKRLAAQAGTSDEQDKIVRGLAIHRDDWAMQLTAQFKIAKSSTAASSVKSESNTHTVRQNLGTASNDTTKVDAMSVATQTVSAISTPAQIHSASAASKGLVLHYTFEPDGLSHNAMVNLANPGTFDGIFTNGAVINSETPLDGKGSLAISRATRSAMVVKNSTELVMGWDYIEAEARVMISTANFANQNNIIHVSNGSGQARFRFTLRDGGKLFVGLRFHKLNDSSTFMAYYAGSPTGEVYLNSDTAYDVGVIVDARKVSADQPWGTVRFRYKLVTDNEWKVVDGFTRANNTWTNAWLDEPNSGIAIGSRQGASENNEDFDGLIDNVKISRTPQGAE